MKLDLKVTAIRRHEMATTMNLRVSIIVPARNGEIKNVRFLCYTVLINVSSAREPVILFSPDPLKNAGFGS